MNKRVLSLVILVSTSLILASKAGAQAPPNPPAVVETTVKTVETKSETKDSDDNVKSKSEKKVVTTTTKEIPVEAPENPRRFGVMLEYSPLDLILPSKIGGSVGYAPIDSQSTYELEYLGATLAPPSFLEDVGNFSDRRFSLIARSYGNRSSFNFHYGLTYFDMQVHVNGRYLQSANGRPANFDVLASRSLGFMIGVGNRWSLPHGFEIGVDWISWSQPLIIVEKNSDLLQYVQNKGDRDTLETLINTIGYFPRFTLLKLGIGYAF